MAILIFGALVAVLLIAINVWYWFFSFRTWLAGRPSKVAKNAAKRDRQEFENEFQFFLMHDPLQARELLRGWVLKQARKKGQVLQTDAQRLHDWVQLEAVNGRDRLKPSDAEWRLANVVGKNVFFRADLTFAGYADYRKGIEQILDNLLRQQKLSLSDAEFLRRIYCLAELKKCGEHYGLLKFPYPMVRYRIDGAVGKYFFLDEMLSLVVALERDRDGWLDVVWERVGARQPGLYSKR